MPAVPVRLTTPGRLHTCRKQVQEIALKDINSLVKQCMSAPSSPKSMALRLQDAVYELKMSQRAIEALEQLVSDDDIDKPSRDFRSVNRFDLGQLMLIVNKDMREKLGCVESLASALQQDLPSEG
jgi:hypothetical protein